MWEAGTRGIDKQRSFRSEMALWGDCRALEFMVLAYSGNKLTAAFSYGLRQPIRQCTGEAILVKQIVILGQIPLMVGAQAMQLCCPAQNRTWLINHSLQLTRQAAVTVTPQTVLLCSAGGLNSGTSLNLWHRGEHQALAPPCLSFGFCSAFCKSYIIQPQNWP